jgi:hypothetical protein
MPGAYLLNLIGTDAVLTPSTEDAAYPAEYLIDHQAARVFRGTSQTALSILVDMGASVSADTIALVNHNLTAAATLSLKAGATSPPSSVVATPTYRAGDLWKGFTATAARYWLLEITDANSAAIQIGQLLIGTRVVFPRGRRIGNYTPRTERTIISGETYGGASYHYPVHSRKTFNPSYRCLLSELAIFETLESAVYGSAYPWLYIPEITASDCYYVRKEESFEPTEADKSTEPVMDYQMTLREEPRGLEVEE